MVGCKTPKQKTILFTANSEIYTQDEIIKSFTIEYREGPARLSQCFCHFNKRERPFKDIALLQCCPPYRSAATLVVVLWEDLIKGAKSLPKQRRAANGHGQRSSAHDVKSESHAQTIAARSSSSKRKLLIQL